jgi:CRP-like cAMP-binding protein
VTFFDYPTGVHAADTVDAAGQQFWRDASESDWADLLRIATLRKLAAGETLIAPGLAERSVYVVLEGQLEILVPAARKWKRLATVGAGSVVGELAFLDGAARSALVRALTTTSAAELTYASFTALSRTRPELALSIALDLGRIVAQRLRKAQGTP